jgi:ATP-binding cassette subfamily B protein
MTNAVRKTLSAYLWTHRWYIALIVILQFLGACSQVYMILLLKPIINAVTEDKDMGLVLDLGFTLIFTTVLFAIFVASSSRLSSRVASAVSSEMRMDIMTASLRSEDLSKMGRNTSSTMTCLSSDVTVVQDFVFESLRTYLPLPMLVFLLLAYTYMINSNIALVLLIAFILIAFLIIFLSQGMFEKTVLRMERLDRINNSLREKITRARMIRSYDGIEYEKEKFSVLSNEFGQSNVDITLRSYYIPHLTSALMWLMIVMIYLVVIVDLNETTISPDELVIFMQYTTCFIGTLTIIPYLFLTLPRMQASAKRIESMVNAKADPRTGMDTPTGSEYAIEAEDVAFVDRLGRYVVDGTSFRIPKGSRVTITGKNGCGKTEMVDMILGFEVPLEGRVSVEGKDVSATDPAVVRSYISYIGNTPEIFSDTVRFNLDPRGLHDDREIIEMCARTGFDSTLSLMSEGLDSKLSPELYLLSNGQMQLLAITRCLLDDTDIYLFDDCLFSIDVPTRRKVISAVDEVCAESTVVFAMHDTFTAVISDDVLFMDNGRIVGQGTHRELLGGCPQYREMYDTDNARRYLC